MKQANRTNRRKAAPKLRSPDQFKAELQAEGKTISEWARERAFDPNLVMAVLSNPKRGRYGESHKIAVAIGLKAGIIKEGPRA